MTNELPEPLVPEDCDLRDFAFMPLEVNRLLTSETWILGTPAEKIAALTLWLVSWHQVPAASLPNDDRMLAHLSQAGSAWKKVKKHAMRGWVLCADGRLYHETVAEKAMDAWEKKEAQRERSRKANAARWGKNDPEGAGAGKRQEGGEGRQTELALRSGDELGECATEGKAIHQGMREGMHDGLLQASRNDPKGQCKGEGEGEEVKTRSSEGSLRSPSSTAADADASGAVGEEGDDPQDVAWCKSADTVALLTLSGKYSPHHARATLREWVKLHGPTVTRQAIEAAQTIAATDPLTYAAKRLANLRAQDAAGVRRGPVASTPDEPWNRLGLTKAEWEAL